VLAAAALVAVALAAAESGVGAIVAVAGVSRATASGADAPTAAASDVAVSGSSTSAAATLGAAVFDTGASAAAVSGAAAPDFGAPAADVSGATGLAEAAAPAHSVPVVAPTVVAEATDAWTLADGPTAAEELLGRGALATKRRSFQHKAEHQE